jgi:hypothetical protein
VVGWVSPSANVVDKNVGRNSTQVEGPSDLHVVGELGGALEQPECHHWSCPTSRSVRSIVVLLRSPRAQVDGSGVCVGFCQASFVVECVEVKAHDRDDLFRRHQVGPQSGMHGEPVGQGVQAFGLEPGRRAGVGTTGEAQAWWSAS